MMSRTAMALAGGGVALLVTPVIAPPLPRLAWNVTPSAPIGLYRVDPHAPPRRGVLVLILPPGPLAQRFAERHYLPLHVPLLKHVAAQPGQLVCRSDTRVTIDGNLAAVALRRDRRGRNLPVWRGCRRLAANALFVLSLGVPDALDGRYFGPSPRSAVVGVATPLWTWNAR